MHYIFIAFFGIAFIVALIKLIFFGDTEIFNTLALTTFERAEFAGGLALKMLGLLTFWMGVMKIGEKGGAINILSKIVGPFFVKIFPSIPKNHPVFGSIVMNFSANMLGLGNAATPIGLKAMTQLQEINEEKDRASNAMIMFLVLNTSGLMLLPTYMMNLRFINGAANPTEVFLPIIMTTAASTFVGFIAVALVQRINIFQKTLLLYITGFLAFWIGLVCFFGTLSKTEIEQFSNLAGGIIVMSIIIVFLMLGWRKKINVYETFIDGAKEGFNIVIKIVPYLVGILVAIGVFQASGALDFIVDMLKVFFGAFGIDTDFVDALPVGLTRPLSGSAAEGAYLNVVNEFKMDSFQEKTAATMYGATDTTFYVIALYFGSVGIKRIRNAAPLGLIADFAGVTAAVIISYMMYR